MIGLSPELGEAGWLFSLYSSCICNLCSSCICEATKFVPCFHFRNPFLHCSSLYSPPGMALWAFWTCRHLWSSFSYVDWTRICLMTIAALSLVAMSCQLLGGRRKWAIVRMILSFQLEQRAWVAPPSPFVLAFWFFPVLETARHFPNILFLKNGGHHSTLILEEFSANEDNICICSYRACCGKEKKQRCVQRQGGVCLQVGTGCPYWSKYPFSKQCQTNSAVTLEWKDTTGWMVPSVMSHFERTPLLCNALP